jgi:hypothetical protein
LTEKPESKIFVLRKSLDDNEASDIIDEKKTSEFKSFLTKPKKEEVHIDSIELFYESLLTVSGRYVADYYRKAIHTISVDSNVQEVIFGGGIFPIKEKSALKKAFVGDRGKNKIDIPLEEHVFVEEENELVFDHNGNEVDIHYKTDSKSIENYPDKILEDNSVNVKRPEIKYDSATQILKESLKSPLEKDIRDLNEEFSVEEITEIYIPIYEARLTGPKNKVGLLRLDAVTKKIL